MLGGGTSAVAYDLETIPAFNLQLNKWQNINTKPDTMAMAPGYPDPRKCHSCIQYVADNGDIEVVIAGGYFEDLKFYNDIWKLNLTTYRWQLFRTACLPFPLYFHDSATSGNGLMYVFGGIEVREHTQTRTNEVYKMWVTIPKLSEICWESLLVYYPRLPTFPLDTLRKIGIPKRFANRIDRSNYKSVLNQ